MAFRIQRPRTCLAITLLALIVGTTADAASASASYTYDPVGRAATALYDDGVCVAYTYDANGNRSSQTNSVASAPETPTWGSGVWGCFLWTL